MATTVEGSPAAAPGSVSDELEAWLAGDGRKTLGGLIEVFEEKAFALIFVLLLGVSALPIPTGGATHVFDVIAVLVAGQLVIGRDRVWIPKRWQGLELAGPRQQKFLGRLVRAIRRLERVSKPRLRFLFDHRLFTTLFGLVVIAFTVAAFLAPPFSGLDTLPALAVVLISLGVLLEDAAIVAIGLVIGLGGVVVEVTVGQAAFNGVKGLI
ncbi:MAG: exopolysaccharide biosynthesis protein [Solirubrobacterales bacterium]|nr:exopolysaccharide biosynthesis protein [Solirubrobacterales bacterium]